MIVHFGINRTATNSDYNTCYVINHIHDCLSWPIVTLVLSIVVLHVYHHIA